MKLNLLRKLLLITLVSVTFSAQAQDTIPSLSAQPRHPNTFWRRFSVGGNLGFQFGSVTGITISPELRIRTIDQLYVGIRAIYQYFNYKNYFWDQKNAQYISYESSVYGGGVYLRYYLASLFDNFLGNIFAHTEYEYLAYTRPYAIDPTGQIFDPYGNPYVPGNQLVEVNSFFVGGGYSQPVGNRVRLDLMLLFNLNDTYNSPYSNPIFRIGVGMGL